MEKIKNYNNSFFKEQIAIAILALLVWVAYNNNFNSLWLKIIEGIIFFTIILYSIYKIKNIKKSDTKNGLATYETVRLVSSIIFVIVMLLLAIIYKF